MQHTLLSVYYPIFCRWVRFGILKNVSLICKDVICYGIGCHIKFVNLITEEKSNITVNFPSINGDGVHVLDGHKTSYTFAYADFCEQPKLHVKNFPEFENIALFEGKIFYKWSRLKS